MNHRLVKRICPALLLMVMLPAAGILPSGHAAAEEKKASTAREKTFALNFNNTELSEFLTVMGQLTGKNIIIDEKVKGKITISSSKKVPVSQAYELMKSILEIKGFAVVETRNAVKILPIQDVIKRNVEVITDGNQENITTGEKTVTFLLELKYADASEVSKTVISLKSKNTEVVTYLPLNTIIFSGTAAEINSLVKIAAALDKEVEEAEETAVQSRGNIHVVHVKNADAVQMAEVLSRIPFSETAKIETSPVPANRENHRPSSQANRTSQTQTASQKKTTKLSIIANKETNSLIIAATPEEFREIMTVIKELDTVREQVLIEALIVEVQADNAWGFGINWMLGSQTGNHIFGGSNLNSIPNFSTSTVAGKKLAMPVNTGLQLGYMPDTSILAFVLLNASGSESDFNILSTPQLLTMDNEEAELNVGEEIPVAANNRISESGTQFYTYEYKSVGIKLKITPHITNSDRITLDLYQEINSVIGKTQVTETGTTIPPTLGKRDIKNKVSVPEGKTIVVGGLIQNQKNETETKIPFLGDIPLLGWFFKNKSVEYQKTNLLVFITPHIVTKAEKLEEITRQKREEQSRMNAEEAFDSKAEDSGKGKTEDRE